MAYGTLYLFPVPLSGMEFGGVVPARNIELMSRVRYFVVEELRTARRMLRAADRSIDIDSLHFEILNEHTPAEAVPAMLEPLLRGEDVGILSEAGCPAVADPGSDLVAAAQRRGIPVVPLVGPSSILMGLMGSGFNGQSFAFEGYLPMDKGQRAAKLREMERRIRRENQTQIFIETPYRNDRLVSDLAASLPGDLLLCVALDITGPSQSIRTMPLSRWKTVQNPCGKTPAIFLLYHHG